MVFGKADGGQVAPFAIIVEQFVGPRIINLENEQIVQRLRLPKDDIQLAIQTCDIRFSDGLKLFCMEKNKAKLFTLMFST